MQDVAAQTLSQPNRRPLLRFVVMLAGLFLLFNIAFYGWIRQNSFFTKYLALNARASVPLIRLFEADAVADRNTIRSARFSLEIKDGCDALQPTAFFILAMLASPVPIPLRRRIPWILMGSAVLLLLNIVRIVTLFFAGLKFSPAIFETFHEDIWQAVFIFLPLIFWISWAMRVTRPPSESAHAAS